ncbi:MAG: T9SS type A sorting domain-containing protein [Bacteroidota bacterium]
MQNKYLLNIITYLLLSTQLFAQEWATTFPTDSVFAGGGMAIGFEVTPAADGGYIVAGEIDFPTGAIRHNLRLAKTDALGNIEWDTIYEVGNIILQEVKLLWEQSDGNILIGGNLNGAPFLSQHTSEGEILWQKQYPSDTSRFVHDGVVDSNGDVLLVGWASISPTEPAQLYCAKMNPNGDLLWEKFQAFSGATIANGVDATADDGYILVGKIDDVLHLFKLHADGDFQWNKGYNFSTNDEGFTIKQTLDQGYIVGGTSVGIANSVPLIFKTDALGDEAWTKMFGDSLMDKINDIALTSDGGYGVVGSMFSFWSFGNFDGYIAKLDGVGEIEWAQNFASANKTLAAIQNTTDGGFIVVGVSSEGMLLEKIGGVITTSEEVRENIVINIFPNPSSHLVNFKIEDSKNLTKHLQIFNLAGKRVAEGIFVADTFLFDANKQPAGIYFFQIKNGDVLLKTGKLTIVR